MTLSKEQRTALDATLQQEMQESKAVAVQRKLHHTSKLRNRSATARYPCAKCATRKHKKLWKSSQMCATGRRRTGTARRATRAITSSSSRNEPELDTQSGWSTLQRQPAPNTRRSFARPWERQSYSITASESGRKVRSKEQKEPRNGENATRKPPRRPPRTPAPPPTTPPRKPNGKAQRPGNPRTPNGP